MFEKKIEDEICRISPLWETFSSQKPANSYCVAILVDKIWNCEVLTFRNDIYYPRVQKYITVIKIWTAEK